jgi:glycosyltransferase involved in cell wall biosynthesis
MKILIVGNDPTIFEHNNNSDTRLRHIEYAKQLNLKEPGSEVYIISYTHRSDGFSTVKAQSLYIFPTNSFHRIMFFYDLLRIGNSILKKTSFDIITTQTPFDDGLAGYLLSRKFKIKFMPQIHFDLYSPWWLKQSFVNRIKLYLSKFVFNNADGIRVVADSLKEKLSQITMKKKIFTIPVSVSLKQTYLFNNKKELLKSKIFPIFKGKKIILFVGTLYYPKNLYALIRVADIVKRVRKDFVFLIVGDGPERNNLEKYAEKKSLLNTVSFLGNKKYEELSEIYALSDLFFLPSIYEGFGRVLVEAFMAKLPVVATQTAGALDIVIDGESGYLVDVEDEYSMAEKIIYLLDNPDITKRFGENGYRYVSKRFDRDNLIKELVEAWMKVTRD